MKLLSKIYEFLKSNWPLVLGIITVLGLAWHSVRTRKTGRLLRSITFDPHGLREPVASIANQQGSGADRAKIKLFLGETGYIATIVTDFYRRQEELRRQLGDEDAGVLEEQVQFVKGRIREDLATLYQLDPQSEQAIQLAGKIEAAMKDFNKEIRKILDRHYSGFLRSIWTRLERKSL